MRQIDLLIVGDALDGPIEEPVQITYLEEALQLFGGYAYEQAAITSGTTSYTLSNTPWGDQVVPLELDSDGLLIPKRLFEFSVSGNVLTWNRSGDFAATADPDTGTPSYSGLVFFRVLLQPGNTSLLKGVASALTLGQPVWAMRLGGTPASGGYGVWSAFSTYGGTRYNGATVTLSGNLLRINPQPGTGRTQNYTASSDQELLDRLYLDRARGYQYIHLSGPANYNSNTLPSGSITLSGGSNGTLTASGLAAWLQTTELDGIDVLCPVGLTTAQLSGSGVYELLEAPSYPTLVVAQAPTTGSVLSGAAYTHATRNSVAVAFKAQYGVGTPFERLDDAAPMVAAAISQRRFGLTLAPLPLPVLPRYSQAELAALTENGYLTAYRSISKGWALWHGVTGNSRWPISTFRAYQELSRVIYRQVEPLLGTTLLTLDSIEEELGEAFTALESGVVLDWSVVRVGDTLYVDVLFTPYGEVRALTFRIGLGSLGQVAPR